jgi:hypothetical protein
MVEKSASAAAAADGDKARSLLARERAVSFLGDAIYRRVTLRARWVMLLRTRWVTLRARWVTLRARWVDAKSSLGDAESSLGGR